MKRGRCILLSSFFFSHPESCLKIRIFCRKERCFRAGPGRRGLQGRRESEKKRKMEKMKIEKNDKIEKLRKTIENKN